MENKRLFYEVWGHLKLENLGYKILAGAMFLVAIGALIVSYYTYSINRVPIVIRVNKSGQAVVLHRLAFQNKVGNGEIYYFTKSFIRELAGFNSYTCKTEIARALNKMSPLYAKFMYNEILRTKLIQNAIKDNVDFHIVFKKIAIRNRTVKHIVLKAIVKINIIANLNSKIIKTDRYIDKIILKRIPRSVDFPFGLEVVNFTETKL
ncbi:MAG: hypothetical protein ACYDEG_08345 [bacterium]